ncbi:MAG: endonuclease/exonuclease/phosphatase family protein [Lachnospiraceae bacterium]|nr:endonuclease/exonuclease/phosphatase family protein [Lachnospiraceae bacterium]
MSAENKKRSPVFRILKAIGVLLLAVVVLFAGLLGFLSVTEYKPEDRTALSVEGTAENPVSEGDSLTIMTWNIGYGALGDNADFFMDGGKMVNTADKARVAENMNGIISALNEYAPDILFLQETDIDSARSQHTNEYAIIGEALPEHCSSFANNFKTAFVPYPVPPIGKVDSGIATFSAYGVSSAERIQLPIPFAWPVRMANLKRCLLISRVPVEGSDRELVLVNLHLEAYDDGEGKAAQTKMLADILEAEAEKGNYVIAGGDFNQIFSSADTNAYPAQPGKWAAGEIDVTSFPEGWQFLMGSSAPTCRSLDQPYAGADKESFQYYLIDGFIVSENIQVNSLATQDLGFVNSDHNPVLMMVTLS